MREVIGMLKVVKLALSGFCIGNLSDESKQKYLKACSHVKQAIECLSDIFE